MREIKFRAWDGEEIRYEFSVQANGDGVNYSGGIVGWPLMQFTGLHDKNGKEIYEGDVIDYGDMYGKKYVSFSDGAFGVISKGKEGASFGSYRIQDGWVVGNIYENPELLTTPTGGKKK